MGELIQIRDYQNKRELDRLYDQVTQELSAMEFSAKLQAWPDCGYQAPEKDPA